jgi:hypothetical protein
MSFSSIWSYVIERAKKDPTQRARNAAIQNLANAIKENYLDKNENLINEAQLRRDIENINNSNNFTLFLTSKPACDVGGYAANINDTYHLCIIDKQIQHMSNLIRGGRKKLSSRKRKNKTKSQPKNSHRRTKSKRSKRRSYNKAFG